MKIAIINCDMDKSEKTNGSVLLRKLIPDAYIIDFCRKERKTNLKQFNGFIITGSVANVTDRIDWIRDLKQLIKKIHKLQKPCLAICFGMELIADMYGGQVMLTNKYQHGFQQIEIKNNNKLFTSLPKKLKVYESHYAVVSKAPSNSTIIAKNKKNIQAFIFANFYCIQFHPEISPTVAKLMALRDKEDFKELLNNIKMNYALPEKIINNFLSIVEETAKSET